MGDGGGDGIPVLLLTGAPGAGKTALAKEIGEQLFHAAVPHAVIDLDEVDGYRAAIPGAHLAVCRVHAPGDVLVTRLQHREPGTIRTFLTDVAPRLDAHIAGLGVEDFTVTNGPNQNISVLAHSVLEQLDWPRPEVANLPT